MTHVTDYAAGPSDPTWKESAGILERGRYRIEPAVDPDRPWILRILRPGSLRSVDAPAGAHTTMTGAKAWATHYDVESLRHLRLLRHGLLGVLVLITAVLTYVASIPADSAPKFVGVVLVLVLFNTGVRELVWFGTVILTSPSSEDLRRSTTIIDRAVARSVGGILRPIDEEPESGTQVVIVDDWGSDGQG